MPDGSTLDSPTLVCRTCITEKPIDQFRRRRRGDDRRRETECRECHNAQMQLQRLKSKSKEYRDAMQQIAKARNAAEVHAGMRILIDAVGGLQGLAARFAAEWQASPPGSKQRWWYTKAALKLAFKGL